MLKEGNTRLTIVITKEIRDKLIKEAEFEDRSVSNLVSKILKEHYKIKTDE